MKSLRNRVLFIAASTLAAVCASAIPVSAQNAFQGSFTLTHEVQWQNATLPAGVYTFEMKSLNTPARILIHGPNGYQFVTALVADEKTSERSMLLVLRQSGRSVVSELYLAEIGRCLRYAVPKARKDAELAKVPPRTEQIVVAVNVK